MNQVQGRKLAKRIWICSTLLLFIGVCVCMMVNYLLSRELAWSLYPAGAAVLALGMVTALLFGGKHRLILAIAVLALWVMPFLTLVEHLSASGSWAWPVGFPIAAVSVLALLLVTLLLRYTQINRWYCASIAVLLAVPVNLTAGHVVSLYWNEGKGIFQWVSDIASIIGICALAFYFVVLGRRKGKE